MVLGGTRIPFLLGEQGQPEVYSRKAFRVRKCHRDTAHQYINGPRMRTSSRGIRIVL